MVHASEVLSVRNAAGKAPRAAAICSIALVGAGFVADLYTTSVKRYPNVSVVGAFDRDASRPAAFSTNWSANATIRDSLTS